MDPVAYAAGIDGLRILALPAADGRCGGDGAFEREPLPDKELATLLTLASDPFRLADFMSLWLRALCKPLPEVLG